MYTTLSLLSEMEKKSSICIVSQSLEKSLPFLTLEKLMPDGKVRNRQSTSEEKNKGCSQLVSIVDCERKSLQRLKKKIRSVIY